MISSATMDVQAPWVVRRVSLALYLGNASRLRR